MRFLFAAIIAATLLFTGVQPASGVIPPPPAQSDVYTWANYAGLDGSSTGFADATGRTARFSSIQPPVVDSAGNVFVGDQSRIRKITPAGEVSTFLGSATAGYLDGTGAAAQLGSVQAMGIDAADNLYFWDSFRIRKATPAGVVTTLIGSGTAGTSNGTGTAARVKVVSGIAVDPGTGDIYFTGSDFRVRKITPGLVVTTVAGSGSTQFADGTGTAASFGQLGGAFWGPDGNLYVADSGNNAIRKVTPAGVVTTPIGGHGAGYVDGSGATAAFNYPSGLVIDPAGNVFITDLFNSALRKVALDGSVSTVAGGSGIGSADGPGATATFYQPTGLARDAGGNLFLSDQGNGAFRKVDPSYEVTTLASRGSRAGSTDGAVAAAQFNQPRGVAVDPAGNTFVVERGTFAGEGTLGGFRKITPAGVVSTLSGIPSSPDSVAADRFGNVYVGHSNFVRIYQVTSAGVVTTLAGNGSNGFVDGNGIAASFNAPSGVAADAAGNVYVADKGNHAIRKITPAGDVTTLAGNGASGTADGTGAGATFASPLCVAVDAAGTVYVGNADRIRKVTSTGVVTTLTAAVGAKGLAVDSAGDLYAANGDVIQKITAAGVVTTIGGAAGVATSLDGVGTEARFSSAVGLAIDRNSVLYVADSAENRIAKGTTDYVPLPEPTPTPTATPFPTPAPTPVPAVAPKILIKASSKHTTHTAVVKIGGTSNSSVVKVQWKLGNGGALHAVRTGASWTLRITGLKRGKTTVYVRGVTATGVVTPFKKYKVTRR